MYAQNFPGLRFQVKEGIYDAKSMLDETNFYHQGQGSPSVLTKKLTYIMSQQMNGAYSIGASTFGGGSFGNKGTSVLVDDVQFTYPMMGDLDKASSVAYSMYSQGDQPGIGNSLFQIPFEDNWIKAGYFIVSPRGIHAYVHEVKPNGTRGYLATVQMEGPADEACPLSELESGANWIELHTGVAESESRSIENKMAMPGSFKNQMSFMRTGWSWSGNAANKVMIINASMGDGKGGSNTTEVWMDFALWQYEMRYAADCEHFYIYSKYNRKFDGTIDLKDLLTGKVIPRGAGLLDQIWNKSTFTDLTYNILSKKLGHVTFGTSNKSMTLMGGTGARRDIHKALMDAGAVLLGGNLGEVADKFVHGSSPYNLTLGGYFDSFYHIDGVLFTFKYHPIFDTGRVARVSPKHPVSGLPLESHRIVVLDHNDYDGGPNIRHVAQKGREYMDGIVRGLTPTPRSINIMQGGKGAGKLNDVMTGINLATDQDKSMYTRFKSAGIQLMNGKNCLDLRCTAGL